MNFEVFVLVELFETLLDVLPPELRLGFRYPWVKIFENFEVVSSVEIPEVLVYCVEFPDVL